jgi:hypothetical protein
MRFQRLLAVDNDGVRTAPKVALHARAHQPVHRALRPKNDSKGRRESGAGAASAASSQRWRSAAPHAIRTSNRETVYWLGKAPSLTEDVSLYLVI